jgi:hypothetical protein
VVTLVLIADEELLIDELKLLILDVVATELDDVEDEVVDVVVVEDETDDVVLLLRELL